VIPSEPEDNYKIGSKEFWEQFSKKPWDGWQQHGRDWK
jgi:hypothetical protein